MSTEMVIWEPSLEQQLRIACQVRQCVKQVRQCFNAVGHMVAQAISTLAPLVNSIADAIQRIQGKGTPCTRSHSQTVRPCSYPRHAAIASTRKQEHSQCGVNISAHYVHAQQDTGHPSARSHLR